jgi:hypothetical protein
MIFAPMRLAISVNGIFFSKRIQKIYSKVKVICAAEEMICMKTNDACVMCYHHSKRRCHLCFSEQQEKKIKS